MPVTDQKQAPTSPSNYVEFDEFIEFQLKKTRAGIHQTDLLTAGVVLLSVLTAYLLLFAVIDQWVLPGGLSNGARAILLSLLLLASAVWVGMKIVRPWMRRINSLYAARVIEHAHPELKSSLLTWVNFRQSGREVSPGIRAALEKRTATQIAHANVDEAVDRRHLMLVSYVLLGLVIAICLYTLLSPKKMSTTLWRAFFPTASVAAATRTEIRDVKPGHAEVLARDQVDVTAELGGQIPQTVTLFFTTADRRFVEEPIQMRSTGEEVPRFRARLTGDGGKGLLSDVSYYITAGDAKSRTYQIRVNQPPSAAVTEIAYEYPLYMGLAPSVQQGSTIDAWEGTTVTVRAQSNMPVKRAVLYCTDEETGRESAEEYPMTLEDGRLAATWQLRIRPDDALYARYYHIQVWNERNQTDPTPTIHRIKIRPDLKPEITLIHPNKDLTAPANATVPIAFTAQDPDFLLRRVSLKIKQGDEELPFPPPLFAAPPEMREFKSIYRLQLDKLSVKPGDKVSFSLEAEDNFEPFGKRNKNITRTVPVTITIADPQPPEQAEQFNKQQEEQLHEKLPPPSSPDEPQQKFQNQGQAPKPEQPPQEAKDQPQDQPQRRPPDAQPDAAPDGQKGKGDQSRGEASQGTPQPGNQTGQSTGKSETTDDTPQPGGEPRQSQSAREHQDSGRDPGGKQGSKSSGEPSQQGGSTGQQQPGATPSRGDSKSAPKDKAAEDQALRDLLEWSKKQDENGAGQSPSPQPQKGSDSDSTSQPPPQQQTPDQQGSAGKRGENMKNQGAGSDAPESAPAGQGSQGPSPGKPQGETGQDPQPGKPDQQPGSAADQPGSRSMQKNDGQPATDSQAKPSNQSTSPDAAGKAGENPQPGKEQQPGNQSQPGGSGQGSQSAPGQPNMPSPSGEAGSSPASPMNPSAPGQTSPTQGTPNGSQGAPSQSASDQGTPASQQQGQNTSQQGKPSGSPDRATGASGPGEKSQDGQPGKSSDQNQSTPAGQSSSPTQQSQPGGSQPGQPGQMNSPAEKPDGNAPPNGPGDKPGAKPAQDGLAPQPGDQGNPAADNKNRTPSDQMPSRDQGQPGGSQQGGSQQGGSQQGGSQQGGSQQGGSQQGGSQQGGSQQGGSQQGGSQQGGSQQGGSQQGGSGGRQMGSPASGGGNGGNVGDLSSSGSGDGNESLTPEEADLANKKKATNLALKRLRERLERGEVPQDLKEQLGYSDQELERFMERLQERLADPGLDRSPESDAARRQFESLLKGIDYDASGQLRGGGQHERKASESFGSGNRPVPPAYRRDNEAYKRKLSREGTEN